MLSERRETGAAFPIPPPAAAATPPLFSSPAAKPTKHLSKTTKKTIATTGEWAADPSSVCFEEVTYTMFTLSQFLGFLEIVRREGPRERSFLQLGSPHGGDTLATLLEGVKYALCASPVTLEAWLAEPPGGRDHPGARTRTRRGAMRTRSPDAEDEAEVMAMAAAHAAGNGYGSGSGNGSGNGNGSGSGNGNGSGNGATRSEPATTNGNGNGGGNGNGNSNVTAAAVLLPAATAPVRAASPASAAAAAAAAAGPSLRISRGLQRAIGSVMVATPMGAERHYTLSYSEFVARLRSDPQFAAWFRPLERDLAALLTGPSWRGRAPGVHAWTRVLLLQQLLVDAVDLLDPDFVRVPPSRRLRLSPVPYAPLPNVDVFRLQLSALSTGIDPIISAALRQAGGAGPPAGEAGGPPEGTRSLFLEWARARGMMGGGTAAAAAATAAAGGALPGAAAASNGAAAPAHVHFAALANLQAEWDGTVSGSGSSVDGGDGGVGGTGAPGGGGGGGAFTFCGEPVLPAALLPDVGVSGVSLLDLKERPRQAQQEQQQQQQAGWAPAGPIASLFLPLGGLLEQVRGGM